MLPSKWENVKRCSAKLIDFSEKLPLALDCKESKYSQYIYNIHIFQFWRGLCGLFPLLFPKASASCCKTKFCCIVLPYLWAQKMFLRLLNPYFKLDILNICALCGAFFSRYVRIKSSFCDEKNISGEIWDTL